MSKFHIPETVIYICTDSKCGNKGGKALYKSARSFAKVFDEGKLEVIKTECTDRCKFAPVCSIQPGNTWLKEYKEKDVLKILQTKLQQTNNEDV